MQVKTSIDEIQGYLTDASNMSGGHTLKLFIPESVEEISEILREASRERTPVTISGARTGTVGGAVPFGGVVVSLERLNSLSIDKENRRAVVGAGVVLSDLQKAAEAQSLFYPPDPTEWSCQVGGTVATNASGARSFKYGATRSYVRRLTVVLADGTVANIERGRQVLGDGGLELAGRAIAARPLTYQRPQVRKNVSGYFNAYPLDLIDLFIGSEGTLGVLAEIELDLLEKPHGVFGGIVFFDSNDDLLRCVNEVRESSFAARAGTTAGIAVDASVLEYFDEQSLSFISEKFPETPQRRAGAVFFEQETTTDTEDEIFSLWNSLLERCGADIDRSWFGTEEQDREKMRKFRHALPVSVNERIAKYGRRKVGTDMAVPDENFANFLAFYKRILGESGIDYVIFGHIGDCHLHANLLPKTDEEAVRAKHIYGRCVAQAIMLGGTVSAEHGIGKLKRKYLEVMMGERYLNEMADLKRTLDPNGILGRGNMFEESFLQ
jgi:D-lactate dehydrogenase (cytochrome)